MDHTRLAWLSGKGRIAMGPPRAGRKRWYAVARFDGEESSVRSSSKERD